jgi:hypothetical protein
LPLIQAQSQLQGLGRLKQRLAEARGGDLVSIRAEISASIAATQLLVQQSRVAAATQSVEEVLRDARRAVREEVTSLAEDFYEKKKFDPYLRFASAEDEAAYRQREAERRQRIEEEMAKGTPQGDLAAAKLLSEQMKDAGAHGANASPEFGTRMTSLSTATTKLQGALSKSASADQGIDDVLDAGDSGKPADIALADQTKDGHGLSTKRPAAGPPAARGV